MRYLSVCAGIESATVAWHDLGWQPAAFSEIEPFPSAVLKHHYPDVPNVGDMTKFKEWDIGTIDLLVGGTPCQSFSVAVLRKGLDDPRGNLMLTYLAIANQYRPKWLVWENVPGVLSSNGGSDFASLLRGMGEIGYGFAYRVLDAQYFGVAQRRRRVFVVGCLGDWRAAAAVLFERESLSGNPAPSREKGQEVAGTIAARFGISRNKHEECVTWPATVAPTLDAHYGNKMGLENQHINGGGDCLSVAKCLITKTRLDAETETLIPTIGGHFSCDPSHTITTACVHGVAQAIDYEYNAHGIDEPTGPLLKGSPTGGGHPLPAVMQLPSMAVRRLTPVECERLQGFPDNYTNIPWRNKPESPDGPRYKALGNSMAVPVMKWIGERINQVELI